MSTVLDSEPNTNYEPSQDEIKEYGKWLGMKLPEDNCFLWIAREGLKAPLPEYWKACKSEKGELYYFNFKTGSSIWDHPMDEHYKELFKQEKKNPSQQSIGMGAKSTGGADAGGESGPKKIRKKPLPDPDSEESAGGQSKGKVPTLNTLKRNKTLPDSLKIDFDTGNGKYSGKSTASAALEPSPAGEKAPAEAKPGPQSILAPGKLAPHDEVIASGFSGVKALSKINSPGGPKSEEGTAKSAVGRARSPVQHKEDAGKEIEEARRHASEELTALKKQLETEKEKSIAQYKKEMDQALIEERRKIDDEFSNAIESLREEYEEQKRVEVNLVKKEFAKKLEDEKELIEQTFNHEVKEFRQQKNAESTKVREAQSAALDDAQRTYVDLKSFASSFVQAYEDHYLSMAQAISRSMADMDLQQQKIDQAKRELDLELRKLKEDNRALVLQEKEKSINEIESIKRNHLQKISLLNNENDEEISRIKADHAKNIEAAQKEVGRLQEQYEELRRSKEALTSNIEKEKEEIFNPGPPAASAAPAAPVAPVAPAAPAATAAPAAPAAPAATVAPTATSESLELRTSLQAIADKAKEEIAQAFSGSMKKFLEEYGLQVVPTSSPSSQATNDNDGALSCGSASPAEVQQPSSGSSGAHRRSEEAAYKRPTLDNNLLKASPEPLGFEAPRSPQEREGMKHVLTEILHEIFATSPFITPSPSKSKEPEVRSPTSRSAAREPSIRSSGFMPGSHDVVESERQRLRQAERFIENQRQHLEERRRKLRLLRNQWKERVLQAKSEGVRSTSQRGRELKAQGMTLEIKSGNLDREMGVLHQSELWLQNKKQRLAEYESLCEEHTRMMYGGGSASPEKESGLNWSIDTGYLMTGFFNPGDHQGGLSSSREFGGGSCPISPAHQNSRSTSPMVATALHRIEERLDKVSTMIDKTNRHMSGRPRAASPGDQYSPTTPSPQPQSGRRSHHARGEFKGVLIAADSGRGAPSPAVRHADPASGRGMAVKRTNSRGMR